jgi:hypothetical protein
MKSNGHEHPVCRRRIGSMPMEAELAMAAAMQARRLRLAASRHPEHTVASVLLAHAEAARTVLGKYRANRTWVYGGGRQHSYSYKVEGTGNA